MPVSQAARSAERPAATGAGAASRPGSVSILWVTVADLLWAGAASTLHRLRGGEGALLAINLSLIVHQGSSFGRGTAQAIVSGLAIGLMYALNDLHDAPTDSNNPKKNQELISIYLAHRRAFAVSIAVLKLLTIALAYVTLGTAPTLAVAGVMLVNLSYSTALKGVPVVDVVWCGLWGSLYAAIVGSSPVLLVVVGLMTAVCHLYQALDDRVADAANAITTTAVRSAGLSRIVLATLSLVLFLVLRGPLGSAAALSAFIPLGIYFASTKARTGWLLTKLYFGVLWLCLLGITSATL